MEALVTPIDEGEGIPELVRELESLETGTGKIMEERIVARESKRWVKELHS